MGDYVLMFRVTDTETGVVTLASAALEVTTLTGSGLMVIGENLEGNTQVDFISMATDTIVLTNAMNESTGFDNNAKPINICKAGKGKNNYWLYVMTDKEAWDVDLKTLNVKAGKEFSNNSYITDEETFPDKDFYVVDFFPHFTPNMFREETRNNIAVCSNGLLFAGRTGFLDPINKFGDEKDVSYAKPYMLASIMYYSPDEFLYYDEVHERFIKGTRGNSWSPSSISRMTDNVGDPFPWNQQEVGRTLQYAQNSSNTDNGSTYGNSFALMRDKATGDYYIYKMYVRNYSKLDCYTLGQMATDLDKAGFHVFSSKRTALYYTVGSKLYGVDYNKGNEKVTLIKDFGSDEITMMKVDEIKEPNNDYIYVATYNSTDGGTLYKMQQGTNPDKLELMEVPNGKWTGLSKVKSMTYK